MGNSTQAGFDFGYELVKLERHEDVVSATPLTFNIAALPAKRGWDAIVRDSDGDTLYLSLLDGEERWALDGRVLSNAFPVFYNGWGSRCMVVERPSLNDPAVALLNAAIKEA